MALVSEASVTFCGTIRNTRFETAQDGKSYLRAQVENDDGISDISFNEADTQSHRLVQNGQQVSWIIRPSLVSGVSQRNGKPYAFLSLRFLRDADAIDDKLFAA